MLLMVQTSVEAASVEAISVEVISEASKLHQSLIIYDSLLSLSLFWIYHNNLRLHLLCEPGCNSVLGSGRSEMRKIIIR